MEYKIKNINVYNENEIDNFYDSLYSLKKERISKYKHYINKKSSIIGDIILCELLNKHDLSYSNLEFMMNENGKPYIKDKKYYYNISHSFDYIITVISNNDIGIDIEKIRKTPLNVINQFATEKEKKYILSSNKKIEERIFKIYTLKEAYFKMKGSNLNNVLDIEFYVNENNVKCSDSGVKVGFINDVKGYIISYCEKI